MTRAAIGTRRVGPTALAVAALRELGMPWTEIDAILETPDPRLVRQYLQLHAELLEERLAKQRAVLLSIERILRSGDRSRVVEKMGCP